MTKDVIPRAVLVNNLVKSAGEIGVRSITFTGDGEPTLNPALWEAVEVARSLGIDVGVATNGIALDEKKILCLLRNCTWLRFNLSAHDQESYKRVHGVDGWERMHRNIMSAVILKSKDKSIKCTIGLQMVLIPRCVESVVPEAELARFWGVEYFVIKQFSDPGCEGMSQFDLGRYDSEELQEILRMAEELSNERTKIIAKRKMMSWKGTRPYDKCRDCPLIFQVSGNSKCYPCGYLFNAEEFCYGDLKVNTLKEIIDSERYWSIIKKMETTFDPHRDCKGACRHDFTNEFIHNYVNQPEHINFI
jgi:MoaA/NifB/PqqE/SkfB family radical SAM enzyme